MKKGAAGVCSFALLLLAGMSVFSCRKGAEGVSSAGEAADKKALTADQLDPRKVQEQERQKTPLSKKSVGYAFGVLMGVTLQDSKLDVDLGQVWKGLKKTVSADKDKQALADAQDVLQRAFEAYRQKEVEKNSQEAKAFLEENAKKPGVQVTSSGLQYEVVKAADGPKPQGGQRVRTQYKGTLLDGTVFDASRDKPAEFPVDGMVPGVSEGLKMMPVGSTYRFYVPSSLGYGERGIEGVIPPGALLVFEIELQEILPDSASKK
ncbi:FKBP-type peptidyl-prolyl cis-trans isomerase [Treponema paraluiscuniculi]|nr:FKBP-type peptidyl-prolyl cis-trans isomerase [Treponema paraluiscuniculi]